MFEINDLNIIEEIIKISIGTFFGFISAIILMSISSLIKVIYTKQQNQKSICSFLIYIAQELQDYIYHDPNRIKHISLENITENYNIVLNNECINIPYKVINESYKKWLEMEYYLPSQKETKDEFNTRSNNAEENKIKLQKAINELKDCKKGKTYMFLKHSFIKIKNLLTR